MSSVFSRSSNATAPALALAACLLSGVGPVLAAEPAPAFELPTREASVQLEALRGKVVLVDFWASWCGPCRESFPWMNAMYRKYHDQGLEIVAINVDADTRDAEVFLQNNPAGFTVAFDPSGTTPELFGVMGMPSSYLVNRQGGIKSEHVGFRIAEKEEYERQIRELLNE